MANHSKGNFTVLEGLDGIGKGKVGEAIADFQLENGKIELPIIPKSKEFFEDFTDVGENDSLRDAFPGEYFLRTHEPTYVGIGRAIREEITHNNGREYSSDLQIQAYSLDRLVQMQRVVIPFLESDQDVLQVRNFASTWAYQSLVAKREGKSIEEVREKILSHPGNRIELEYSPDLMIISTINDTSELIKRLENRKKKDNSIFENVKFQEELKPFYEDSSMKELFESHGTRVAYLDAGISEEATKEQAIEIFSDFYDGRGIKEKYKKPNSQ